jgi:phosphoglycerate dehydrogenase-like enzyme
VIGVGVIGKPIAERLFKSGFRLFVYDVRDELLVAREKTGPRRRSQLPPRDDSLLFGFPRITAEEALLSAQVRWH